MTTEQQAAIQQADTGTIFTTSYIKSMLARCLRDAAAGSWRLRVAFYATAVV